jgi:predicted NBD/HSP70 family sugar kinase
MGGLMTKPTPSHNDPVSIGIDFHKRYSVFCVLDATGGILERGRIEHTTPELFVELAKRYPKARVVFETTMNCPSLRSRLANQASPIFKAAKWRRALGVALRNP